jgi:hypothetical protein
MFAAHMGFAKSPLVSNFLGSASFRPWRLWYQGRAVFAAPKLDLGRGHRVGFLAALGGLR